MSKQTIIAKVPLDNEGRPTISLDVIEKITAIANEKLPEDVTLVAMPFADYFVLSDDKIEDMDKVKTMSFDDLKKFTASDK